MTMEEARIYTREEANAALPELRERLVRIRDARQTMLRGAERVKAAVEADGGGHAGTDLWRASRALKAEIEWLASQNILLRDPETGLLDFPAELDGREVFLCWRAGEQEVAYWHDVEAGFAGRQPL
jgi:hypothetical protein